MKRTALARKTGLSKRKKTPNRGLPVPKTIDEQLDELCRQIVMIRDGFRCRKCRKGIHNGQNVLQVHHIRTKGAHPNLRWELDNLLLVCRAPCHLFFFHGRDAAEAAEWYQENLGADHMARLSLLVKVRKGAKMDKQAIKLYLEAELEKLQSGKIPGVTVPGFHEDPAWKRPPPKEG